MGARLVNKNEDSAEHEYIGITPPSLDWHCWNNSQEQWLLANFNIEPQTWLRIRGHFNCDPHVYTLHMLTLVGGRIKDKNQK